MKKKLLFMSLVTLMIVGCSGNDGEDDFVAQEVTVNIDYSLWESGSMTKSGESLYTDFYNKYIKTKLLTPTSAYSGACPFNLEPLFFEFQIETSSL